MKNFFNKKNILCLMSFLFSSSLAVTAEDLSTEINFFSDNNFVSMVGLSCSSVQECKNRCNNSISCQKPVETCLNCIGSRSPYISDFFNNVGELTTACKDSNFLNLKTRDIFENLNLVPISPYSAYNPLGLKDINLFLKFMSLCPVGTQEPVVIGITSLNTHAIVEIPMVKCGSSIFPLVRMGEDCAQKAEQIYSYIDKQKELKKETEASVQNLIFEKEQALIQYDVLQFSDFVEASYVGCSIQSSALCKKLCHSTVSCSLPLNNKNTTLGINYFNNNQFKSCGLEIFNANILLKYLDKEGFSFNSRSLSQSFELNENFNKTNFDDFSDINSILNIFGNIFTSTSVINNNGTFFISDSYRNRLESKMQVFCDKNEYPFILGVNGVVERVFCKKINGGYFNVIAKISESCDEKINKILNVKDGVLK